MAAGAGGVGLLHSGDALFGFAPVCWCGDAGGAAFACASPLRSCSRTSRSCGGSSCRLMEVHFVETTHGPCTFGASIAWLLLLLRKLWLRMCGSLVGVPEA